MPTTLTSEEQNERFLKLPESLQEAISSVNTADAIFEIGRAHKFTIEKVGVLGQETGLVMSGISPAKEFVPALETGLKIPREEANAIAAEINEKLFLPIREYMKKFHGDRWEGQFAKRGTGDLALGTRMSGQKPVTTEPGVSNMQQITSNRPQVADTAPVRPEPLIIRPLGRPTDEESRIKNLESSNIAPVKTKPNPESAKPIIPASEKEISPPIVKPIWRGLGSTDSASLIAAQPIASPKPLMPIPPAPVKAANVEVVGDSTAAVPVAPRRPTPIPPAIPSYYEEAKKKMEQEIQQLANSGERIADRPSEQTPNQQLSANSQQQPLGEAKKVVEPFRPSPHVISVGDSEKRTADSVQRIENNGQAISNTQQETSNNKQETKDNQQLPGTPSVPVAPTISVTPPASSEQQRRADSAQRIADRTTTPIPTNPALNPIRLDKKIPKPPAPESYSVDPYRETTE